MQNPSRAYIAHVRESDQSQQALETHLQEVAEICKQLAQKLGNEQAGELIGLLHDFGKYSEQFQNYIQSATGLLDPDLDDAYVDAKSLKGKIDHSSAGAQWIWQTLSQFNDPKVNLFAQIMALCVASHHSGLIDCLKLDGSNSFKERMQKLDNYTHLEECQQNAAPEIIQHAQQLADKALLSAMQKQFDQLMTLAKSQNSTMIFQFYLGFWTRFLFSCLIDADRINSADFENIEQADYRNRQVDWTIAVDRVAHFLSQFPAKQPIDLIRQRISENCKQRASDPQGIYTLTVPTGGGKTLASLRYAIHHAKTHHLERIIYVIPYTSIIEQNADVIRKVIEKEGDLLPWVLEHHSNLEPEQQTWHSKLAAENWDSPIVLTTMVQFLETLFSGGTRGVRRLHQLANSVIIFDEIQTLPIRCTHLFCNALNFLSSQTKTTVLLCTATQPLLDKLKVAEKGQLLLSQSPELMDDAPALFEQLKRVLISDKTKNVGWTEQEIVDLALQEFNENGNCLVIVNTKVWARQLYLRCMESVDKDSLFHLSTSQCPAHRQASFHKMRARLDAGLPVLCFSTQLIEAGVDIDFSSVIRFLAGLDSIAQAAGRCNRNGRLSTATVHIVNPAIEHIDQLTDIKIGKEKTQRILSEVASDHLLEINAMSRYFKYYFYDRADEMSYPVNDRETGSCSLLSLLSDNKTNINAEQVMQLRHAFMTAGKAFKAIDAPTQSVIVPYNDEAKQIITTLCGIKKQFDVKTYRESLKKAQKFSVNVFSTDWKKLLEQKAIIEIGEGEGVYCLDDPFYSLDFGLSTEIVAKRELNLL
jgi:CRISPR-associated endonuclease/helicase Cas3